MNKLPGFLAVAGLVVITVQFALARGGGGGFHGGGGGFHGGGFSGGGFRGGEADGYRSGGFGGYGGEHARLPTDGGFGRAAGVSGIAGRGISGWYGSVGAARAAGVRNAFHDF